MPGLIWAGNDKEKKMLTHNAVQNQYLLIRRSFVNTKVTYHFVKGLPARLQNRKFNPDLILMSLQPLPVEYIGSYQKVSQCPALDLPEYCFIGRSNVGKSSVINLVTGLNEIARTSKKPGKTQSINLFSVNEEVPWIIADLPGYGFAQVSKTTRGQWSKLIEGYIQKRENLVCTFLLLDIRHPRMEIDRAFMNFLGENNIPFCMVFTKSDKLKPVALQQALLDYQEDILKEWESVPTFFVTSSWKQLGRDEILTEIRRLNYIFNQESKNNE